MGNRLSTRVLAMVVALAAGGNLLIAPQVIAYEHDIYSVYKDVRKGHFSASSVQCFVDEVISRYHHWDLYASSFKGMMAIRRNSFAVSLSSLIERFDIINNKDRLNSTCFNRFNFPKSDVTLSTMSDVSPSHPYANSLKVVLDKYGVMSGFPNSKFKGDKWVTKFEMVVAIANTLAAISQMVPTDESNFDDLPKFPLGSFVDVPPTHYSFTSITMVHNQLQLMGPRYQFDDVPKSHWSYYDVIQVTSHFQVIEPFPDFEFNGNEILTRFELADALARLLVRAQEGVNANKYAQ